MNHTITIRTLSEGEIEKAIKLLEAYRLTASNRISRAMDTLAMLASEELRRNVGSSGRAVKNGGSRVSWSRLEDEGLKYLITVNGQQIGFLEFGTGVYADEQHPYVDNVPFPVFSGSYSDTIGQGTWNDWIQSGKDPMKYPYNRVPKRPLYLTSLWIRDNWKRVIMAEMQKISS